MQIETYDVIVVGAGAAGLMAAMELLQNKKTVALIDAKPYIGGRMYTISNPDFEQPVELGAEFVHGDLPLTATLFKKAGISQYKISGASWQQEGDTLKKQDQDFSGFNSLLKKLETLTEDISVAELMQLFLSSDDNSELRFWLTNYVQGYYAGDVAKASAFALYKELTSGEDNDYRVTGGYKNLAAYLETECRKQGGRFYLSEEVKEVLWSGTGVKVVTNSQTYQSKKILITVSIGVLQSEQLIFTPALPGKTAAARQLGFGHVVKVVMQFSDAFWKDKNFTGGKDLREANFIFSERAIPTWWTHHPKNEALLTGWLAGPPAADFVSATAGVIKEKALQSLAGIFAVAPTVLQQKLRGVEWYNWSADQQFCGAYSYSVVGGDALMKTVAEPAGGTVYFAGEGLYSGNEIGTVEAALNSGRVVAHQIIKDYYK